MIGSKQAKGSDLKPIRTGEGDRDGQRKRGKRLCDHVLIASKQAKGFDLKPSRSPSQHAMPGCVTSVAPVFMPPLVVALEVGASVFDRSVFDARCLPDGSSTWSSLLLRNTAVLRNTPLITYVWYKYFRVLCLYQHTSHCCTF